MRCNVRQFLQRTLRKKEMCSSFQETHTDTEHLMYTNTFGNSGTCLQDLYPPQGLRSPSYIEYLNIISSIESNLQHK
jgi:hypothetical protein